MEHLDEATIKEYLEGALGEDEQSAIEGHCASCEQCFEKIRIARLDVSNEKVRESLLDSFTLTNFARTNSRLKIVSEKLEKKIRQR